MISELLCHVCLDDGKYYRMHTCDQCGRDVHRSCCRLAPEWDGIHDAGKALPYRCNECGGPDE
jgi:hypothetical protein